MQLGHSLALLEQRGAEFRPPCNIQAVHPTRVHVSNRLRLAQQARFQPPTWPLEESLKNYLKMFQIFQKQSALLDKGLRPSSAEETHQNHMSIRGETPRTSASAAVHWLLNGSKYLSPEALKMSGFWRLASFQPRNAARRARTKTCQWLRSVGPTWSVPCYTTPCPAETLALKRLVPAVLSRGVNPAQFPRNWHPLQATPSPLLRASASDKRLYPSL
jgi:hypothetical protein